MQRVDLPIVNDLGYYEMWLESIGGLGANLCGKLLGELGAMYLGLGAASFASYGSEKRGSQLNPIFAGAGLAKRCGLTAPCITPMYWAFFMKHC